MKLNDIKNYSKNDLLELLGLRTRRSGWGSVLGSLGLLGLGAMVGAAAALLVTPHSGKRLRRELGDRVGGTARRLADGAREGLRARS